MLGQLSGAGEFSYRKMFGEYLVYLNGKQVLSVCDNTVYVKMLPELAELLGDAQVGYPYEGAKPCYILDIDDSALAVKAVTAVERATPLPTKKARKYKR